MRTEISGEPVSDMAAAETAAGDGMRLKLQRTPSFPYKMTTAAPVAMAEVFGGGPTFYSGSKEGARFTRAIYDSAVGGGGGAAAMTLQPFNTYTAFKSPGGGMAASLRFPFTSTQWQELERQALIYKYMMASVPVPPDLLMTISRNPSQPIASQSTMGRGACFNLRFSSSTDPEPGRCRRTDGKKWRCSRDVAPDQKYCERHMHRGRPRSRKPVELQAEGEDNNIASNNAPSATSTPATACLPTIATNTSNISFHRLAAEKFDTQPSRVLVDPAYKVSPFETNFPSLSYKQPGCAEWTSKGETVSFTAFDQQWQQQMNTKVAFRTDSNLCNATVYRQHYKEATNLNLHSHLGEGEGSEQQQTDNCCLLLNTGFVSLDGSSGSDRRQTPRGFIDAWSTAGSENTTASRGKSPVSSNGILSLSSSLTLSMSGGCGMGEEMDQVQRDLGVMGSERDIGEGCQPSSWMNPVSWVSSPPGGPLGEVLLPSGAATVTGASNGVCPESCSGGTTGKKSSYGGEDLNLMSDFWGVGSDPSSPPATTASSPSGVLQKTLVSLSDSSGSSSPSFTAGVPKSEIAIQWSNQSK
ncbi:PREDICTED: growth-regulating factor 2 [Nelumbo nucifera]|uniref:Growth-regulating factor n=1 Tax=Nelumbo nucifera TaxID=4432 RepID=A0A1U7ZSW5_NELNU|nr:PREDICTED: growth-regulating factor 2 [Nelumbo nucifera]